MVFFDQSGKFRAIRRAVEHIKGADGIQAKVFRRALMRDIAPGFEEPVDCDALLEMFTIIPSIELDFV
jgi:hypothetical protein